MVKCNEFCDESCLNVVVDFLNGEKFLEKEGIREEWINMKIKNYR